MAYWSFDVAIPSKVRSTMAKKLVRDTIEWHELLEKLVAREDVRAAFMGPREDYFAKRLWLIVSGLLDSEQIELEPQERMLFQGELLNHFFPKGLPREE